MAGGDGMNGAPRPLAGLSARIAWRLMPLLLTSYVVAYIDRINVGFAKLHLREVLGVDDRVFGSVYGVGAGLFFLGYFLFEVPSNLIMQRVGARIWIARIMVVWGVVSGAMVFVGSAQAFYAMRFLLGVAEAGFFPGVLLYLTAWFPARERAKTVAMFAVGGLVAGIVGSPLSGAILGLDGVGGLAGWQWLFILEAAPAIVLGVVVFFALPDGPQDVAWMSADEKRLLRERLESDALAGSGTKSTLSAAFASGRVWLLCLLYFLLNVGGYGYEMWLPTIVKGFSGQADGIVGWINAVPYATAAVVMLWSGRHSDRTGDRRGHVAVSAFVSAAGFGLAAFLHNPWLAMTALTVAFVGLKSALGPFWAMGTTLLSGTAAAAGIAFINSVGNLGGFVGPTLVGVIRDRTGSDTAALYSLGGALLLMGLVALFLTNAGGTARQTSADAHRAAPSGLKD
jgi:MFS transporter, ACS family, tartrate transporter